MKIKSSDVKTSPYIEFDIENIKKDSIFKVGDHARISKYKKNSKPN